LTEAWGVDTDAVRCRLMQPLEESLFSSDASADDLGVVLPHNPRPGTMRVKLLIHEQGRLRDTIDISVSTQLYAEVVVAQTNLPRHHVLQEIDLISRWQAVSKPGESTPQSALVGKSLTMPLRAGQIVQARYVSATSVAAEPVVRTRDTVRLVARKGALTITLSDAEVLQNGAIGDRVRVRNPNSKKIVTAVVVSRNEVAVEM
jgi:flagella basal body P-ring formation protein FlgA